jgi:hypothetical protein
VARDRLARAPSGGSHDPRPSACNPTAVEPAADRPRAAAGRTDAVAPLTARPRRVAPRGRGAGRRVDHRLPPRSPAPRGAGGGELRDELEALQAEIDPWLLDGGDATDDLVALEEALEEAELDAYDTFGLDPWDDGFDDGVET